ncbi:MAG TPA: phosphoglucomutase/phosphomannomutase family protein [Terriglobia bacterium]|nr:phosphoglucomutase/phosphomannomutase family protein [Terriglobia bacterium]
MPPRYNDGVNSDNPIKFGTSGWRGIIAEDFTFANVRLAASAIAHHLLAESASPQVVVGYDTRFLSDRFAQVAADTLCSHGVTTYLCSRAEATPAIAHDIIHSQRQGGVNITASHNPAEYNGLKFSGADGGPALPEVTHDIERLAGEIKSDSFPLRQAQDPQALRHSADPRPAYLEALRGLVDFKVLEKARLKVAYHPLYGAGRGYLDQMLREHGTPVFTVDDFRDPLFGGSGPDPNEANLARLSRLVKEKECAVGLATDGDADRFGVVDSDGTWIHPNYVLGVLADYLIEQRKFPGGLGRSVATTHLIDAVARYHNVPLYETPVGFKYVGELIRQDKIAMGGEESAGMSVRGHVPEKDGILACLLVAEAVARTGLSVRQQIDRLFDKTGPVYSIRINVRLTPEVSRTLPEKLKLDLERVEKRKVARVDRTDGLKLTFEDGSWMLVRLSGTEPVARIYCEAPSHIELDALVNASKVFVVG